MGALWPTWEQCHSNTLQPYIPSGWLLFTTIHLDTQKLQGHGNPQSYLWYGFPLAFAEETEIEWCWPTQVYQLTISVPTDLVHRAETITDSIPKYTYWLAILKDIKACSQYFKRYCVYFIQSWSHQWNSWLCEGPGVRHRCVPADSLGVAGTSELFFGPMDS